jgi:hypothetical protein
VGEHRPLLGSPQLDRPVADRDLERSEDAELHGVRTLRRVPGAWEGHEGLTYGPRSSTAALLREALRRRAEKGLTRRSDVRSDFRPADLSVEVRGFEPLTPAVRRQCGVRPLPVLSGLSPAQGVLWLRPSTTFLSPFRTTSAAFLPPLQVDPLDRVLLGASCRVCLLWLAAQCL